MSNYLSPEIANQVREVYDTIIMYRAIVKNAEDFYTSAVENITGELITTFRRLVAMQSLGLTNYEKMFLGQHIQHIAQRLCDLFEELKKAETPTSLPIIASELQPVAVN
jgi:hypothetical protein